MNSPFQKEDATTKVCPEHAGGVYEAQAQRIADKDGSQIPVQTRVTHGMWNGGDVLFALSRDISDLKETQEALQQASLALYHAKEMGRNRVVVAE